MSKLTAIMIVIVLISVTGWFYPVGSACGKTVEKTSVYHWSFQNRDYFLVLHMSSSRSVHISKNGDVWKIFLNITRADYLHYKVYPGAYRYAFNVSYLSYFMTVHDPDIENLSKALNEISLKSGFDRLTELNFILAFVQEALAYISDIDDTGFVDYYKFPLETLVEGGGDCEDKSLLMFTISKILGYNVILFALNVTINGRVMGHVAVGVDASNIAYGPYAVYLRDGFEYGGKMYYYMETTANETERLGFSPVHYYVGVSPEEAGYYLSNVRFVTYNGYVYSGYSPDYRWVAVGRSTLQFPWFLVLIAVIISVYVPLFAMCVSNQKKLCPYCGMEIESEYEYCPNCGFWIKFDEPPPRFPQ